MPDLEKTAAHAFASYVVYCRPLPDVPMALSAS